MPYLLLPQPRQATWGDEVFTLPAQGRIAVQTADIHPSVRELRDELQSAGYPYTLTPASTEGEIRLLHDASLPIEGYRLRIDADGIVITAAGAAGHFYGLCTLRQLRLQAGAVLPYVEIDDAPDFAQRGFMLDISRDRVPTMDSLFRLIDTLAALKYNHLQLYTEHTFAYPGHEAVWQHADPLTADEVRQLDAYCRERFIALVPNQNSLGHMERWLKHDAYAHLAHVPGGFVDRNGRRRVPTTLAPAEPAAFALVSELFDVLLPNFQSRFVNVGCDEPWELDQDDNPESGRVYLEWLLRLHRALSERGHKMMFWGDIIIKHPDLVPELPDDIIVMEWGYEANHPFERNCQRYAEAGKPFFVCPGTSSWNALAGRVHNAVENIRKAAAAGLRHGALGMLITDWGDNGHWQPFAASYAGIAYGAGVGWCYDRNHDLDLPAALDAFVYRDAAGVMGAATVGLGNIYREIGPEYINGQILNYALQWEPVDFAAHVERVQMWGGAPSDVSPGTLRRVITLIDGYRAQMADARMARDDATLLLQEWALVADLLRHSAHMILRIQGETDTPPDALGRELETLIVRHRENWLARSRPGGLDDSLGRFETLRRAYANGSL